MAEINQIIAAPILDDVEISIPARFRQIAAFYPDHQALAGTAWQPTYAELDAVTNRLANLLISHGGKTGDRVALLMRHDAPLIAAALAALKAGRMVVVLNPNDPPERLKQILADAEPASIITDLSQRDLAETIAQKNQTVIDFEKQFSAPAHSPEIKIAPGDPAWLVYTSGSTGRPKGVIQTHRNLVHKVLRLSQGMNLTATDKIILLGSPSSGQGTTTVCCALLNGAALCPFPIGEKGAAGLGKWMVSQKITIYISSASVFRHFVKTLNETDFFSDVRLVRLGSEIATANDFAAYQKFFSRKCFLISALSSSETGNITHQRLTHDSVVAGDRLPIGSPAIGMEILLCDENGREVPAGETGEIIVRSKYLSPGYWRNETLTAERFSETGGVRIFRSGDLGKRTADGAFFFAGRKDARVKIHGYRVELSEVEDALVQQAQVENAIVLAHTAPDGGVRLAAHVIPRTGQICTAEILRRALRRTLPGHMIPAHFVFLEKFPLAPGGKIDREQLRRTDFSIPTQPLTEEPATETEKLLVEIWEKVFNRDSVGRRADFFDHGGDSLNAAVMTAEIYAALGIELDLRVFADHPVLADLAQVIDQSLGPGDKKKSPGLARASRDVPLPLSFTQERIWKYSQTPEGLLAYTVACSHRICGPLDVEILRASMDYLMRRHEILRTTFDEVAGKLAQIVHPPEPVSLEFLDFSDAPDAEEKAAEFFRKAARHLFDLKQLPLLRFALLRIREDEYRLVRVSHHIISDTWSWQIYFRELKLIYESKKRAEIPPLPELEPLHYGDYAARQRSELNPENPAYREMINWWSHLFADRLPPMKLPFRRFWRSRRAMPADGLIWWGLKPAISRRLDQIACESDATYYTIRLAAFAALLATRSNRNNVVLRTYVTGRNRVELQNMFGDFVNLVTLRLQCGHAQTFREWLRVVNKIVGEIQARSEIPYEQLCDELRKNHMKPPALRVTFSVATHTAPVHFGGLKLTWLDRRIESMPQGFGVVFDQHNEEDRCRAAFNAVIYNPARVQEWINRFVRFLDVVSNHPDLPLDKLLAMT